MQQERATKSAALLLLPALTSVVVVLRVPAAGERISALPHVVALISASLDYSKFWSLPRACEANLLPLLPRLAFHHESRDDEAPTNDPFYWKYQCSQGLLAAVRHDNLNMATWLHKHCPSVLPYAAMTTAAKTGNLSMLQWLTERHERAVWISQIMDAAASTNQVAVLEWLHAHPKNGTCTSKAFSSAVENGHLDAVKWIHSHYSSVLINPFHEVLEAIRNGHIKVAKYLYEQPQFCLSVAKGIDYAAERGDLELVQWLVSNYATSQRLTNGAIDYAARGGHLEVVQWLHDHLPNGDPRLAMTYAAQNGHLEVIQWLHHNRSEGSSATTMNLAASHGHLEVVKWLHENRTEGCSTHAMDGAASNGHLEVVQWLCENRTEGCSCGALSRAATNGHLEVCKWLFANVTQECVAYEIDNVAANGHLDVIEWIAEHQVGGGGCSSDAMNSAAENGHLHVVQWLHDHGIEDDAPFAMDFAAENGHLAIVTWLFDHRSEGCTRDAIGAATASGHFEIMRFLHANLCACSELLPDTIDDGEVCIKNMEIVQWCYDKNPESVNLSKLWEYGHSYMPALLEHILGVSPATG